MIPADKIQEKLNEFIEAHIELIDYNNWYSLIRKCPFELITPLLEFAEKAQLIIPNNKNPHYVIEDNNYSLFPAGLEDAEWVNIQIQNVNYMRATAQSLSLIRFNNPLEAEKFRKNFLFRNASMALGQSAIPYNNISVRCDSNDALIKSHRWVKVNTYYGHCYINYDLAARLALETPIKLLDLQGGDTTVRTLSSPNWWIGEEI